MSDAGYWLAHADDNMVLSQRLAEWISNAPELEADIAIGNIALDHLGVSRALYGTVSRLDGSARSEDEWAMLRDEREYRNALLVEQPNGDFAMTMVRQLFFDAYQLLLWRQHSQSEDLEIAGIAARALKEARYHFEHSSGWVVRMGDGTEESHRRAQAAVDTLWRFTGELFEGRDDRPEWERMIGEVLDVATLETPEDPYQRSGGRNGFHTEHLGHLLAEMQWMQRAYPGLRW